MRTFAQWVRAGSVARRGALLGIALTFAYGAAFFVYAAVRAMLVIGAVDPDAGRAATLAATTLSLFVACLSFSAALAPISAAAGAVTAMIIAAVVARRSHTRHAAAVGVAVCIGLVAIVLAILHVVTGIADPMRFRSALVFWLALPVAIFVTAGAAFATSLSMARPLR